MKPIRIVFKQLVDVNFTAMIFEVTFKILECRIFG